MVAVNIYGIEASVTVEDTEGNVSNDECLTAMQALLPPGPAWSREPGATLTALVNALSYEYARVRRRGRELLRELDPRVTKEMLDDWERVFASPSSYNLAPPETLAERRTALYDRVLGFPDPTPQSFIDLAASLGYTIDISMNTRTSLFRCVSPCNFPCYARFWIYVWTVTSLPGGNVPNLAGDNQLLRQAIAERNPAHTVTLYDFLDMTWSVQTSGLNVSLYGIIDFNGLWVAVGDHIGAAPAKILTSPDGVTWTSRTSNTANSVALNAVAYGPTTGLIAAVGSLKTVVYSSNGTSWTAADTTDIDGTLVGIAEGPQGWAIVTDGGVIFMKIDLTSNDDPWNALATGAGAFHAVGYGNGLYIAVGDSGKLWISHDLDTWANRSLPDLDVDFYGIAYDDGLWVAVGDTAIYSSSDALTWVKRDLSEISPDTFYGVTTKGKYCVAVGDSGVNVSAGGRFWALADAPIAAGLRSVARRRDGSESWCVVGTNATGDAAIATYTKP